jgi:hypothetical protein
MSLLGIVVKDAEYLLRTIFCTKVEEVTYRGVNTDVSEILQIRPELAKVPASAVRIRFFGGPPGRYGWFNGTVQTYLCDKIMWCTAIGDTAKMNRFFDAILP